MRYCANKLKNEISKRVNKQIENGFTSFAFVK